MSFYIFGALLFSGGSILASTAINDKANGAAMMSFINMFSATIAVIVMGYASANPLKAFIDILLGMWILVVGLLVWHYYHSCEQNKQLQKVWK